jgi:hypothetical protein
MPDMNMFQFLVSDENEVVLLLYAREGHADRPLARLFRNEQKIEIYRSGDDELTLEQVDDNIFVLLNGKHNFMVCEVLPAENEGEVEIIDSYFIEITE